MKLSFFILCCIFITLQYESAEGGLVKDFFGQVHDTAQHVRNDVRNVLHLNKKDENKKPDETNKESDQTPAKETDIKNEVKPQEGQKEIKVASVTELENKNVEQVQQAKQPAIKNEDKPKESDHNENSVPAVTSTTVSNTVDKDGRENFTGACAPGYVRTADGRCKQSF